jgi:hypothetical protein
MPRGFCQRVNYEERFGKVLRGVVYSNGKCKEAEKILGIGKTTLSSRFKNPGKMSITELKLFIKMGNIPEEDILNYLYERSGKGA